MMTIIAILLVIIAFAVAPDLMWGLTAIALWLAAAALVIAGIFVLIIFAGV